MWMPEEKAREGSTDDPRIAKPGRALKRLQAGEREAAEQVRRNFGHAAVVVSGEVGYRKLTVALITRRAGAGRTAFYRHFADKHEAYRSGYEAGIEALAGRLLEAGRDAPSWAEGLRVALEQLAGFTVGEPDNAGGLLAQVHVAGGAALDKRKEVSERLSRAIDGARRETHPSRHSPPPIAAEFIVSAIEQSVISAITRGVPEEFAEAVPDLVDLAVSTYFGPEAAGGRGVD
jgi:AcrR family transcriptional regulator